MKRSAWERIKVEGGSIFRRIPPHPGLLPEGEKERELKSSRHEDINKSVHYWDDYHA